MEEKGRQVGDQPEVRRVLGFEHGHEPGASLLRGLQFGCDTCASIVDGRQCFAQESEVLPGDGGILGDVSAEDNLERFG